MAEVATNGSEALRGMIGMMLPEIREQSEHVEGLAQLYQTHHRQKVSSLLYALRTDIVKS